MRLVDLAAPSRTSVVMMAQPRRVLSSLPFDEARNMARSMGLSSVDEWNEYACPGAYRLPNDPDIVWADEWKGWDDWLGTMLPIDAAREVLMQNGIATQDDYAAFVRSAKDDAGRLPADPARFWRDAWPGWDAFLAPCTPPPSPPPAPPPALPPSPPPPMLRPTSPRRAPPPSASLSSSPASLWPPPNVGRVPDPMCPDVHLHVGMPFVAACRLLDNTV